jgi:hypothetical protein
MPEKGWKWHILWAIYNSSLTAEGSVSSSSLVGSASVLEVASFVLSFNFFYIIFLFNDCIRTDA